jgi:hypothetical protein
MRHNSQGLQWWVVGSAVLMVIGAFGPWVKVLGLSVGGTDGSNDGWLVVAAAAIGGLLSYVMRNGRGGGVWALLAGIAGVAVTLYDRSNVQDAIKSGGALGAALAEVGWGLNLALAASASMAIAGFVYLIKHRDAQQSLPAELPPPTPPPVGAPTPPPE